MAKPKEKLKAIAMRRRGKSIKEIAKVLKVSPGSVSAWCSDITLSEKQKDILLKKQIKAGNKGRMIGAQRNYKKKQENVQFQEKEARETIGKIKQRDILMLGIGLYWGEGTKTDKAPASIVNSNPDVILFAKKWFKQLGVEDPEFMPYIYISESHAYRKNIIKSFWAKKLELPLKQIKNVIILKGRPKKVYENHDSYYGVLALRISRSASLKYRILGLIKASVNNMSG